MPGSSHHPERRAQRRVSSSLDIRYGTHGEMQRAKVCDVCPAGIGLSGPIAYPVGTNLELRFQPAAEPRGDMLLVRANVRHSLENRMGLKFDDRAPAERQRILRLIEHLREDAERSIGTPSESKPN